MDEISTKCQGDILDEIPKEIIEKQRFLFPKVHIDSNSMALLSKDIKDHNKNSICILPFCNTVEAEALGSDIQLGDEKYGPRVNKYKYSSVEEMLNNLDIDFSKGRVRSVLDAIKILSDKGEIVSLNVEGPFTIISSMIDPLILYKSIRKNPEDVNEILNSIEKNVVKYIKEAISRGAKIISYGDPVGTKDIVGTKVFKEFSGPSSYRILKSIEEHITNEIVHVCVQTSVPLEEFGFISVKKVVTSCDEIYGNIIKGLLGKLKFIGHSCIKRTRFSMNKSYIWEIKLK
ncbi:uroporphyrinogen-III decarboxylase [Gottschalkia purinilytica]|uniref:Uroporphyrinogen-III decarboxylase n=1 Tax=Gottschalkia purinilytica TaxID=1503 RepID=A0A0L0W814_GOTPU|nr:uroporphyrinogen decarboxylase family protein [Gottschalkia purinilytica]KNF07713.1 uroporphyrinogen-III decarboxylase [Gottschalkia purinilytica]